MHPVFQKCCAQLELFSIMPSAAAGPCIPIQGSPKASTRGFYSLCSHYVDAGLPRRLKETMHFVQLEWLSSKLCPVHSKRLCREYATGSFLTVGIML